MKGTIFQSESIHLYFDVNTLTNRGEGTPLAGVWVGYCIGRKAQVNKVEGYGHQNQVQIQKAVRARELGLEVEVPTAIPHPYDYKEEDMEEVIEDYEKSLPYLFSYDEYAPERSYFVKTKNGTIQQWVLRDGWEMRGGRSWEVNLDPNIRKLVPQPIADYCDRLIAHLQSENDRHWKEVKVAEKEQLRKEFGLLS